MKGLSYPARRPMWRLLVIICVFAVILGFGACYFMVTKTGESENSGSKDLTPSVSETKTSKSPEELESGVILEETRITVPEPEGSLGWSFSAKKIEYDAAGNSANLIAVEGMRFNEGRPELEIQAGAVELDFTTGSVDFKDYVTVKSDKGPSFSAAAATWDPDAKSFRAYGNIQYENSSLEISGDELEVDLEFEIARVKGNARFRSPAF